MPIEPCDIPYGYTREQYEAFRRAHESIRLIQTAITAWMLRCPAKFSPRSSPLTEDPDSISREDFRFEITRWISTKLWQPERCSLKVCRRTKICHGDPPDCWRDEPRHTEEEWRKPMRCSSAC